MNYVNITNRATEKQKDADYKNIYVDYISPRHSRCFRGSRNAKVALRQLSDVSQYWGQVSLFVMIVNTRWS